MPKKRRNHQRSKVLAFLHNSKALQTLIPYFAAGSLKLVFEIRAAIEMNRRNPSKAVEFLQAVSPYELGVVDSLYSAYLRGLAYLLLRQGSEAATEFQRILDHRSIVQNNSQGALARLGLARAYAMQGDTAKAKAAYQDFLALWKDADADIPVLIAAKAEYATLH